jgi:anti-anti-sigma factor
MTTDSLRCRVVERFPVSVVRVDGPLGFATAPDVRRVLLGQLAEQPQGLVVDLAGTVVVDNVGLTVFAAAAEHAAEWPAVPIVLCAASGEVLQAIDRVGLHRHIPVFRTRRDALRNIRALGSAARRASLELEPKPESAAVARGVVDRVCRTWNLGHLLDSARLVAGELVANSVLHARTRIGLRLELRDMYLHLAVRDRSTRLPSRLRADDPLLENGRGLVIVDALATAWGTVQAANSKVVWATLLVHPPGPEYVN